ncbi:hypothetical protein ACWOC1_02750 [Enterococcus quebecensis]|uniref:Uncharacterized protein n=1 Tax=Enterococcus quebecensis TaxID=903983 RepID=A0A1E5GRK0_9ENTE|nr:hypothetical protein [Enterococcus quebecensis]OEG15299.1 hypothetical protein BCR23_10725 [Enterococcus quebecensis]OJG72261.1 hypothetical protein RV12_GL000967 [Enterococcus quebecensis]
MMNKTRRSLVIGLVITVVLVLGVVWAVGKNNKTAEEDNSTKSSITSKEKESLPEKDSTDKTTDMSVNSYSQSMTKSEQSEYDEAAKEGENKESAFDVKLKDGTTVAAEDIANARHALSQAGINDTFYSDKDIADLIQESSNSSLDIVTVVKDREKGIND